MSEEINTSAATVPINVITSGILEGKNDEPESKSNIYIIISETESDEHAFTDIETESEFFLKYTSEENIIVTEYTLQTDNDELLEISE